MMPYYQGELVTIYLGDCREILPSLSNGSAIVTDPPYELGFMGKSWDSQGVSFQKETWEIIRKACLSGSPLLSFGGSRTQHRIACAIEDAGWEIRDTLMWVYGSGFPKSLDISKAIDKQNGQDISWFIDYCLQVAAGKGIPRKELTALFPSKTGGITGWLYNKASHKQSLTAEQFNRLRDFLGLPFADLQQAEREVLGKTRATYGYQANGTRWDNDHFITAPATPAARLWEGYGTALKPAYEPIILAMNPLDGTFANNALKHKVAGLNIDGCRIGYKLDDLDARQSRDGINAINKEYEGRLFGREKAIIATNYHGRFPANFLHDGSQMVMELFPQSSVTGKRTLASRDRFEFANPLPNSGMTNRKETEYTDNGSAARFFYVAKASKGERGDNNGHPTVKPLALMEYLCKLVKMPEYNLILDPFCGSGTTLLACIKLGIPCIGIDSDEQTCEIAARRCSEEVMELV